MAASASRAVRAVSVPPKFPSFHIIRGVSPVLAHRDRLAAVARRYGQGEVTAHLSHFVSAARASGKNPCLLLSNDECSQIEAAILLLEYAPAGIPTGVFVSADFAGERDVLAPFDQRPLIARRAAEHLITRGAKLVLVALHETDFSAFQHLDDRLPNVVYGTATREIARTLALQPNYEETLASFGAHTRRNFRAYRRRAQAQLGVSFCSGAQLSEREFLWLNRKSLYPARAAVARWRFRVARTLPGSFFAGLRANDGRWLALVGGRRAGCHAYVDWQLNTGEHPALSLGTVLRSFLIEDEVQRGTETLTFEGGTPHTMNRSLRTERVGELLLAGPLLSPYLLRTVVPRLLPHGNQLGQSLLNSEFAWCI